MQEVIKRDNVAVITGGASGIGRATAIKLAGLGMKIAIVDVNAQKLAMARQELADLAGGADRIMAEQVDVSDAEAMMALAGRVAATLGPVAFLMNNAAMFVHGGDRDILAPLSVWHSVFAVNFFGILNGVAAFVPNMLRSGAPGMVVNTGSKQGLTHPPGNPSYNTVKAAVNAYTQNLAHELRNREDGRVSAHLLVPGWTTTGDNPHMPGAWLPGQVADYMLEHLEKVSFYIICPDDETTPEMDRKRILWQALDMVENRPALSRWHPDYADAFAAFMERDLKLG
jgi:NAD(P)-dependent dehydrogenase (short-subunit alcohol dehydrogenase family)